MYNKRIISIILVVAFITTFAFFAKNNAVAKTVNINPYQSMYTRVRFNISSETETVTLTKIQQFLAKKQLRPIKIWVLINGDVTAMFTVQKDWSLSSLNKIIAEDILNNYKSRVVNGRKESLMDIKRFREDKEIIKTFSSNPHVQITALDFPYNLSLKSLFETSGTNFAVSNMFYGNIIPSPQLQWILLHQKTESQPSYMLSYDPHQYPDDSTWLPNYVSTDIRTLRDTDETRYIDQEVKWYSDDRMSFFHNHWNSTYEQDSVFWKEQGGIYVANRNPINTWYSNFPYPYEDSRLADKDCVNLSIGCGYGRNLQKDNAYYYTIYAKRGEVNYGHELEVQEQPGHYFGYPSGLTVDSYKTYQHFSELNPGFVPGYYSWYQNL